MAKISNGCWTVDNITMCGVTTISIIVYFDKKPRPDT